MYPIRSISIPKLLLFVLCVSPQDIIATVYPWKAETKYKYYYDDYEHKMSDLFHGTCFNSYKTTKEWDYAAIYPFSKDVHHTYLHLIPCPPTDDSIKEFLSIKPPLAMRTHPPLCRSGYEFKSRPLFKQKGCNVDLLSTYAPRCQTSYIEHTCIHSQLEMNNSLHVLPGKGFIMPESYHNLSAFRPPYPYLLAASGGIHII